MQLPKPNYRLKARIVERYGSQANFAHAARTTDNVVSRIIRGRHRLSESQRNKWLELLKCSPALLDTQPSQERTG